MVSVFMSVHNKASWVGQAVESILNQTYSNFELLITDDGSVDDTGRILFSYKDEDHRVNLIRHSTSQGLASCMLSPVI